MSLKDKVIGAFKRKEEEEEKVPDGRWVLVTYSSNIASKCSRRPKVIYIMNGEKAVGKEMYSRARVSEYEDRFPVVQDSTPPCSEDVNDYTAFGSLKWEEYRLTEPIK